MLINGHLQGCVTIKKSKQSQGTEFIAASCEFRAQYFMLSDNSGEIEILQIRYKIKEEADSLVLKLRGPSMHIFKCFQLAHMPEFEGILESYFPPQHINQSVIFKSALNTEQHSHAALKEKLKVFLDRHKVCIPQAVRDRQSMLQIQKSLAQYRQEIRVYAKEGVSSSYDVQMLIYFPIDVEGLQRRIINTLNHLERFQIFTVVYPLTQFIHKTIENELHELFVNKIAQIYDQQIKKIPDQEFSKYKYLKIKNVEGAKISAHERSPLWLKGESRGIYGLKLTIEGLDHQLIKLYSSLQRFFAKQTYCVKSLNSEVDNQTYLNKKYENRAMKYVYLSSKQYLIFGPAEYYDAAAQEIEKHQWTIKMENYPNMNFEVIKKKEKRFKKQLAQHKIVYEGMKISEREMTFVTNRKNYERIKYFSRQFITANIEVETRLDFIAERHEFECLKRFVLPENVVLDKFELDWRDDAAYCCCSDERVKDTYNELREYYQQCKSQMKSIIKPKTIEDPLVKVIEDPCNLRPQTLVTKRLVSENLQFMIKFEGFRLTPADYAVLMLPNWKNREQLKRIMQQSCDLIMNGKLRLMQKHLQSPNQVKLLILWNYLLGSKYVKQDMLGQQLISIVRQKPEIVFLLTRQIYLSDFRRFLYLLVQIADHQLQLCRKVTIILSDTLSLEEKNAIFSEISLFLQRQFSEKLKSYYSIPQQHMSIASCIKFYELTYQLKGQSNLLNIPCSNLNSFVFGIQRGSRQTGLFLPKNPRLDSGILQVLVNLNSLKAYTITSQKVQIFALDRRKMVLQMSKAIKEFLPHQTYIVLYVKRDEDNALSSLYVYQPKYKNSVKKYALVSSNKRYYFERKQNEYKNIKFRKCDDSPIYQLTTHAEYIDELKRLLR